MAQLASLQITAAASVVTAPVAGFGKPQAATITVRFSYVAASATSVAVRIQTTIDNGATWWDIAAFGFTTASASSYVNVSGLTPVTIPAALSDGTLATGTAINGLLGDRFRVKCDSVGTYGAGTALAVDIETR